MTRKDYELIAASVKASLVDTRQWSLDRGEQNEVNSAISHVVTNIGMAISSDNPQFDLDRFLKACGLTT